ncbi:MAG: NUDIX domain-containing protein [Candidatus Shapirobacteria bacterium]
MQEGKIHVRLRMVIIKNNKLLCSYTQKNDFYFYIGGHLEFGETIEEGCKREIEEECGKETKFKFQKILYVRDFIEIKENEHSVELFILGKVNNFEKLEGRLDSQHPNGDMWLSWLPINNLPNNLYPKELTERLLTDYKTGFKDTQKYLGKIK